MDLNLFRLFNDIYSSAYEGLVILVMFCYLIGKRRFIRENIPKTLFFIISYVIFVNAVYIVPEYAFLLISLFIVMAFISILKTNIYSTIISVILIDIVIVFIDMAVLMAVAIVSGEPIFEVVEESNLLRFIVVSISKSIELTLGLLMYRKDFNPFKRNIFNKENSIIANMLFQGFAFILAIVSLLFVIRNQGIVSIHGQILFILIAMIFLIFIFFDYREREEILNMKSKFLVQKEHVQNMEVVVDIIRKEKHDFANHLSMIFALCSLNNCSAEEKIQKIDSYIRKLSGNLGSSYKFYNTGNSYLDGLLAVKGNYAYENKIAFDVDFGDAPLVGVEVDDIDLTSVIGNIVDNAFDAVAALSEEKQKVVSIYSFIEGDKYCISIANNGTPIPGSDLKRIFENRFTTKKKDNGEARGYGLFIVEQLMRKNKGEISVVSTEESTEFLIKFQLSKNYSECFGKSGHFSVESRNLLNLTEKA